MAVEEFSKFCVEENIEIADVNSYLAAPVCGSIAEATVKELATRAPRAFSAGFVSLGAALLLSARHFRRLTLSETTFDMTIINYLNGGIAKSSLAADASCEKRCDASNNVLTPITIE